MLGISDERGREDGYYHSGNEFGIFGQSRALKPIWVRLIRGKVDDFDIPKREQIFVQLKILD